MHKTSYSLLIKSDLHDFFEELPNLLSGPQAKFSFFNGLGATSKQMYFIYNIAFANINECRCTFL